MSDAAAEEAILARERSALDRWSQGLRYHAFAVNGKPLARWKATSVYRHVGGEWRIAHAHWSTVKDA